MCTLSNMMLDFLDIQPLKHPCNLVAVATLIKYNTSRSCLFCLAMSLPTLPRHTLWINNVAAISMAIFIAHCSLKYVNLARLTQHRQLHCIAKQPHLISFFLWFISSHFAINLVRCNFLIHASCIDFAALYNLNLMASFLNHSK